MICRAASGQGASFRRLAAGDAAAGGAGAPSRSKGSAGWSSPKRRCRWPLGGGPELLASAISVSSPGPS